MDEGAHTSTDTLTNTHIHMAWYGMVLRYIIQWKIFRTAKYPGIAF